MITAISSIKQNSNLRTNANLKRANQVAFKGSPISLLKNEGKISKFADEAASLLGNFFKKLLGKTELPFSKKPLTANATLTHFGTDGMPIDIPMPEVHTAVTKILDGANILNPDAADLAANTANVLATKADVVDAISTGADVLATKADGVDAAHGIIHGIAEIIGHL